MRVKIDVTKNDIKQGTQQDPQWCAIALRVKKLVKKQYRNSVSVINPIEIGDYMSNGNKKMDNFIHDFDTLPKDDVKPISFVIDLPMKYLTNKTIADNRIRN